MNNFDYLDLLPKNLDNIQKQACCAQGNSIVAAGAGSGKTQVLATRFAWLVMSQNIPASQILTLTFTKKAAGEMYRRIYDTLHFFAHNEKTPPTEKERALQALEDFSEVHIQTLDSYNAAIVKQAANIYGIRPDFTSGNGESKQEIRQLALPFVFKNRENKAIKRYAQEGQFQQFANDVISHTIEKYTSLVTSENYFSNMFETQCQEIFKAWEQYVNGNVDICVWKKEPSLSIRQKMEKVALSKDIYEITNYDELISTIMDIAQELPSSTTKYILLAKENLKKVSQLELDNTHNFYTVNDLFSEKGKTTAKALLEEMDILCFSQRGAGKDGKELSSYIMYFKDTFKAIIQGICNFIIESENLKELYALLDEFLVIVNNSKRTSGNLTFKDISELALKVLSENKDILLQEQNAYSRIMIDEFQDNNGKNRDLLFLLCGDKEKLFFVGDEKQSIYKFRGADVSVFNELKTTKGINEPPSMTYNYRSTLEMITAFNLMFEGQTSIFNNSTKENYEATYSKIAYKYDPVAKKVLDFPPLNEKNVPIHFHLLNKDELQESHLSEKDQQAYFIAKTIKEKLQHDASLSYSDFAILDKSRSHRATLTKWLNYFNIDYTTDQQTSLFSDGPINDIYSYLRLCVYPSDKNAYAVYLASPFCGKSINEVLNTLNESIEYHLPDRKEILSQSLSKTISDLWIKSGYYYETMLNKNASQFSSQFDMLFELARQCDQNGKSIAWFVDQLAIVKNSETSSFANETEIDTDELDFPIEKNDSVQIMTIHKSKGLQFKHVFIYGCIDVRAKTDSQKVFFDEQNGLSISESKANNYFYLIQKDLANKKEIAEFRRLIYVAITRAINSIYVVGSWKAVPSEKSKEKDDEENLRLFEKLIRYYYPMIETDEEATKDTIYTENAPFDFTKIVPIESKQAYGQLNLQERKQTIDFDKVYELYQNEPTVVLEKPVSNRKTPSSLEKDFVPYSDEKEHEGGEKYEKAVDYLTNSDFLASDFGTLVHSYLEMQANSIKPEDYIPEPKLLKNLSAKQAKEVMQTCITMCHEFLEHDIGKQFESAKNEGRFYKAEYAFRMFYNDCIFTGSIDLIFENEDKTYTIVDYKSDNEINTEKYVEQQRCYKIAASKILNVAEEKIDCVLYYLKHNKLCKVFK